MLLDPPPAASLVEWPRILLLLPLVYLLLVATGGLVTPNACKSMRCWRRCEDEDDFVDCAIELDVPVLDIDVVVGRVLPLLLVAPVAAEVRLVSRLRGGKWPDAAEAGEERALTRSRLTRGVTLSFGELVAAAAGGLVFALALRGRSRCCCCSLSLSELAMEEETLSDVSR